MDPKTLDHFSISLPLGTSCSLTCCFRFPFSLISYGWCLITMFFSKMELKQMLTSGQSLFGYPVTWICNLLLCLKNWVLLTVACYRATELKTACFNIAEVSHVKISLPAGQKLDLQHLFRCRWWDNCGSVLCLGAGRSLYQATSQWVVQSVSHYSVAWKNRCLTASVVSALHHLKGSLLAPRNALAQVNHFKNIQLFHAWAVCGLGWLYAGSPSREKLQPGNAS